MILTAWQQRHETLHAFEPYDVHPAFTQGILVVVPQHGVDFTAIPHHCLEVRFPTLVVLMLLGESDNNIETCQWAVLPLTSNDLPWFSEERSQLSKVRPAREYRIFHG